MSSTTVWNVDSDSEPERFQKICSEKFERPSGRPMRQKNWKFMKLLNLVTSWTPEMRWDLASCEALFWDDFAMLHETWILRICWNVFWAGCANFKLVKVNTKTPYLHKSNFDVWRIICPTDSFSWYLLRFRVWRQSFDFPLRFWKFRDFFFFFFFFFWNVVILRLV